MDAPPPPPKPCTYGNAVMLRGGGVFTKTIYLSLVVQLLWITHAVFIEDIALLVAGGVNAAFTLFILSYM